MSKNILDKINKLKEKHKNEDKVLTHKSLKNSTSLKERVNVFENQTEENKTNQKNNKNFSDLTKKFGFDVLLNTSSNHNDDNNSLLNNIRNSIIVENDKNFQSKLKLYDKNYKNEQKYNDDLISNFINETNNLCDNYENEIDLLMKRIDDKKFDNLQVCDNEKFGINENSQMVFNKKVEILINNPNPDIIEITNVYNDKITELFLELGKLQSEFVDNNTNMSNLKKDLDECRKNLIEKEKSLNTIHDVYQDKFKDLFELNDNISHQLEEFKKKIIDKDNELDNIRKQNSDYIEETFIKNEEINSVLKNENDNLKLELSNRKTEIEKLMIEQERINNELMELRKYKEDSILNNNTDSNSQLKSYIDNEKKILDDCNKLTTQLNNYSEEINNLKINESELIKENANLKENNSSLKTKIEDLKEIITKDQIKMKDLNEVKDKLVNSNKEINLLIDENNIFKNEIDLFKRRMLEEQNKFKSLQETIDEKQIELESNSNEINKNQKFIKHLEENIEDLKNKLKAKENDKIIEVEKIISTSIDQYALTKELLIDQLFLLYIYNDSLSLHNILDILLNNFTLFMNTIFNRNENFYMSVSILHEFLEDLYLKIYEQYINKNNNWEINQEDINVESKKIIATELLENNIIKLNKKLLNKDNKIDDIINNFINNYEKSFDLGEIKFRTYVEKEVRPKLFEKIEKYKVNIINEIESLIEFAIINLHEGKILYKNNEIYNFKNYFQGFSYKDIKQKHTLYLNDHLSYTEAVDSLIYSLKYESQDLHNIYLNGSFDDYSLSPLARTANSLLLYCRDIIYLSLSDSKINDIQLNYIIKLIDSLNYLKELDLSFNLISDEGLKNMCEYLKSNKTIKTINLNNNNLNSKSGFYLADMFVKNNSIEYISLQDNNINDSGLSSMISILTNNNKILRCLNISSNKLGENDFKPISELISHNNNLTVLNISDNIIDSKSANYLGYAFKQSTRLNVLYMKNMGLNEESFPLLIKNINDSKINELYLDNNPIGEVAVLLGNLLKFNTQLKLLSLKNCKINTISLICLCKSLEYNNILETLNLEENIFDETALIILKKTIIEKILKIKIVLSKKTLQSKDFFKGIDNIITQ